MFISTMLRLLLISSLLLWPGCESFAGTVQAMPASVPATVLALPAGVVEREVTLAGAEGLTLPGTLTLPAVGAKHAGRPPIAVLEQGSGVQDRDGTAGPNKIQQQLAWGLAARGIATLRYDRRAKVAMQSLMAHMDLDHEVVLDAVAALAWAGTVPETDAHRVFLIGHSLGAQLGPEIVAVRLRQARGSVAGLVLLAGIARPIDRVMHEQMAALGAAQGGTPDQIAALQAKYDAIWARARDAKVADETASGLGGGVTVGYLRDWLRRDPAAQLKTLAVPCFVARGTKDLNTTHEDFVLLKAAAVAPGSEAMEFPGLSHLFMAVNGPPNGREAMQAGTISPLLLDAVAQWVTGMK